MDAFLEADADAPSSSGTTKVQLAKKRAKLQGRVEKGKTIIRISGAKLRRSNGSSPGAWPGRNKNGVHDSRARICDTGKESLLTPEYITAAPGVPSWAINDGSDAVVALRLLAVMKALP